MITSGIEIKLCNIGREINCRERKRVKRGMEKGGDKVDEREKKWRKLRKERSE